MSLIKSAVNVKLRIKLYRNDNIYRSLGLCSTKYLFVQKLQYSTNKNYDENLVYKIDPKVQRIRHKIIYSEYLSYERIKLGYLNLIKIRNKLKEIEDKERVLKQINKPVFSVILNDIDDNKNSTDRNVTNTNETFSESDDVELQKIVHMPYASTDSFKIVDTPVDKVKNISEETDNQSLLNTSYKNLYESYLKSKNSIEGKKKQTFIEYANAHRNENFKELESGEYNWMDDYEQYDDTQINPNDWLYGTPNPNSNVSNIPCGGCGALLHCKDHALPGYLPSEIIKNIITNEELKVMVCQRCHFLKHYNTALEVKVSPEEYPELLEVIKRKKCAVILMIDLTDFPCSIWPDIGTILGPYTSVFIVGNKVDLIPKDSPSFQDHIKKCLSIAVEDSGVSYKNIKHVSLISAKTGYGIEELINKLHKIWGKKGDVFVIGCTNVGKSSLFNSLLQSDYCKENAVDLIQRATISPWPGTTLNLLKFPILNPSKRRLYYRMLRLKAERQDKQAKQFITNHNLIVSKDIKYATLEGSIGMTFPSQRNPTSQFDSFALKPDKKNRNKFGIDETQLEYKNSNWCYDTPGTIQPDQIIDLLTIDEILKTLPNEIISPRTFVLQPNETIFIGGLGRLDYLEGNSFIRCTIFAGSMLPITICRLIDANDLYNELLHSEAFLVPANDPERLKLWPPLQSKQFRVTGIDKAESVADVVLSNAGWIAVTPKQDEIVQLKGWTPNGRGIHLRMPALLKYSVNYRGPRILGTPVYKKGRQVYAKEMKSSSID